jgi:hypothetical protein
MWRRREPEKRRELEKRVVLPGVLQSSMGGLSVGSLPKPCEKALAQVWENLLSTPIL